VSFSIAQSANASIKSNRSLLSKRVRLQNTLGGRIKNKTEYNLPKAKRDELIKIRIRIQKEHKILRIKQITALSVFMLILISTIIYLV